MEPIGRETEVEVEWRCGMEEKVKKKKMN